VFTENKTLEWLASSDEPDTVGEWREIISQIPDKGVDPQDLWDLCQNLPYTIEISWLRSGGVEGRYDVVFQPVASVSNITTNPWADLEASFEPQPWDNYHSRPHTRPHSRPQTEKFHRQVTSRIRAFLEEQLPGYMVPKAIVILDRLPLTPNGKIDRTALSAPDQTEILLDENFIPPRTHQEEVVAAILADVLGLDRVGVEDNFFQLGVNSLIAIQVISRVHKILNVDLSLRLVFEFPTVSGLAQAIATARAREQGLEIPTIEAVSRSQPLPLSCSQQLIWSRVKVAPESVQLNIPMMFRYQGNLNRQFLTQSINEIVQRHEIARTTFIEINGVAHQVIHPEMPISVDVVNLAGRSEAELEAEAIEVGTNNARQPFNLSVGPLIRVLLIHKGDDGADRLIITLHHLIADGFSIHNVFYRELVTLYESLLAGESASLPDIHFQYVDYSAWEQKWLQQLSIKPQLDYWQKQLQGLSLLSLPYDYPRPKNRNFQTARQYLNLSKSLLEQLNKVSKQTGVTLFMTLLAAYQALLYHYGKQEDIPVITFTAGVNQQEFQHLLGCFVGILVFRSKLDGNISFRKFLKQVLSVTLGAYSHQDLPFPILMAEVKPILFAGEDRAFQSVFIFDAHLPNLNDKWSVSWMEIYNGETVRDLSLEIQERPEGLVGLFQYSVELFKDSTILQIVKDFERILAAIALDPNQPLLELLSA
jgi:acyl carrier protein